jgi:pimeloyl-ACP methyl ester carboxylesterase
MFVRTAKGFGRAGNVVLLHGLAADAGLNWSAAIPALAQSYRVIAPDLRGHGNAPAASDFTLEDAADDVAALIDERMQGPCIVVGYSMGGAIAQLLAQRRPELVDGLVLCATAQRFRGSNREQLLFSAVPVVRALARLVPDEATRASVRWLTPRLVPGAPRLEDRESTFDVARVLDACAALGRFDSRRWTALLDVPSSVLVHVRDQLVPVERQFELAHALPDCLVNPVDGDHFAAATQPDAFVSTLTRAIRSVVNRSSLRLTGALA